MAIGSGSVIGANLGVATDSAQFGVGATLNGTQDSLWVYVETIGTVTTGMCCSLSTSSTATPMGVTGGLNVAFTDMAFAQGASTSGQFTWMAKRGNNLYIRVSGTTSPSAVLYSAVTSGLLHTTSASGTLAGVSLLAPVSSTAVGIAVLANLTWPKFVNTGN